jgi:hypothetical protein
MPLEALVQMVVLVLPLIFQEQELLMLAVVVALHNKLAKAQVGQVVEAQVPQLELLVPPILAVAAEEQKIMAAAQAAQVL